MGGVAVEGDYRRCHTEPLGHRSDGAEDFLVTNVHAIEYADGARHRDGGRKTVALVVKDFHGSQLRERSTRRYRRHNTPPQPA